VTLGDQTTLRWESGNTNDLSSRLAAAAGATSVALDFAGGSTTFASGVNLGSAELVKQGAGSLTLAGPSTMTGPVTIAAGTVNVTQATALGSGLVTVDGGTLRVNAAISNDITVNSGGTLGGVGSVTLGDVNVATGGTVSPGNSPDTLFGINMTLAGGSTFVWEVRNRTLAAGTGYDSLSLTGSLDLSGASSANRIILKIVSLNASNLIGNAENFANNVTGAGYVAHFDFAQVGSLNLGANANINDVFTVDTSDFRYTDGSLSGALWSLDYDSGSGSITLTAVPEPSTYGFALGALALAAAAVRRRRKTQPKA
jgi:MYXO-CTERM domain-containing protein